MQKIPLKKTKENTPVFGTELPQDTHLLHPFLSHTFQFLLRYSRISKQNPFHEPPKNILSSIIKEVEKSKKQLKKKGYTIDFKKLTENETCTSVVLFVMRILLEEFLLSLPNPICTFEHYDMFIAVHGIPDEKSREEGIIRILELESFPLGHLVALNGLSIFMNNFLNLFEDFGMDSLVKKFAPLILRTEEMKEQDVQAIYEVVKCIVHKIDLNAIIYEKMKKFPENHFIEKTEEQKSIEVLSPKLQDGIIEEKNKMIEDLMQKIREYEKILENVKRVNELMKEENGILREKLKDSKEKNSELTKKCFVLEMKLYSTK